MLFPYRWTSSTAFKNISYFLYSIKIGVKNVVRWTPVVWNDLDFDWAGLASVMEFKLRKMAEYHRKYGHTEDAKELAEEMSYCADILNELIEDDMPENMEWKEYYHNRHMSQKELGFFIGERLCCWWD